MEEKAVNLVLYFINLKRGDIIKVFIRFIRIFLIIMSYLLLIFSIFTLTSGLRIKGSELLPIFFSSILNLFILLIYLRLGKLYIKNSKVSKNRIIKILSKIGFGGNILLLIYSILIIIAFGIIP
ncbi:hypothetical protein [Senegalia sp. (in: firmicutes)]|uniref:hypothetical protein n=1 Tax=Senegalia sp. (in: firmicutes) TaxID=1924098 RepID=UPI003F9C27B8